MPNQRGVMSLKSNSSHCNILTFNLLKQNVTSDEFLQKYFWFSRNYDKQNGGLWCLP